VCRCFSFWSAYTDSKEATGWGNMECLYVGNWVLGWILAQVCCCNGCSGFNHNVSFFSDWLCQLLKTNLLKSI